MQLCGVLRTHKMDFSKAMKDSITPKRAWYGHSRVQSFVVLYF